MRTLIEGVLGGVAVVLRTGLPITAAAYAILLGTAFVLQRRFALTYQRSRAGPIETPASHRPSVDVVVPCFNEERWLLLACLESLARQQYEGELRVWIVDDGSTNRSELLPVYQHYGSQPGWQVIMLPDNQGKRFAQDQVVTRSRGELIVTVDSDTVVWEDGIRNLAALFRDPGVGVAMGSVRAANGWKNRLTHLIAVRYGILFDQERAAQSQFDSVLCCSGSFAMYRRSAIRKVWHRYINQVFLGRRCTWGEDLHLTTLILDEGYKSRYEPRAQAATNVPERLRDYVRQQLRWNRSLYRELWWIVPMLLPRPAYLILDLTARLLVPLLLASAALFAALDVVWHPALVARDGALLAGIALGHLALVLVQTRKAGFPLLYGLVYVCLLVPARIWALCTLRNTRWGTRGAGHVEQTEPMQGLELGRPLGSRARRQAPSQADARRGRVGTCLGSGRARVVMAGLAVLLVIAGFILGVSPLGLEHGQTPPSGTARPTTTAPSHPGRPDLGPSSEAAQASPHDDYQLVPWDPPAVAPPPTTSTSSTTTTTTSSTTTTSTSGTSSSTTTTTTTTTTTLPSTAPTTTSPPAPTAPTTTEPPPTSLG